jgi:hypothetical protein
MSDELASDGGAAEVAGPGQDDVLELLDRRGGNRRIDPRTALVDLARGGNAQGIGFTRSPGARGLAYQSVMITPFAAFA